MTDKWIDTNNSLPEPSVPVRFRLRWSQEIKTGQIEGSMFRTNEYQYYDAHLDVCSWKKCEAPPVFKCRKCGHNKCCNMQNDGQVGGFTDGYYAVNCDKCGELHEGLRAYQITGNYTGQQQINE